MKKSKLITAGIIVAALVLIVVAVAGVNNRAISLEEQISGAEAQISVAEKRRVDLIYNLVDNAIKEIMDITLAAFQADDTVLAEQVEPLEETIDLMIDTLRERHILRLKNGVCAIESGIIFLEILTNLLQHCRAHRGQGIRGRPLRRPRVPPQHARRVCAKFQRDAGAV